MKFRLPRIPLPKFTRSSSIGFLLSALGLFSGAFGITRIIAALAGAPVSMTTVTASLLIGLVMCGAGFSLLVVAADPFDDTSWQAEDDYRSETADCARLADIDDTPFSLPTAGARPPEASHRQAG